MLAALYNPLSKVSCDRQFAHPFVGEEETPGVWQPARGLSDDHRQQALPTGPALLQRP
jgi:hypothetical protein